jgi:hypothetical protein
MQTEVSLENRRRDLQDQLDREKSQRERNRLGQYATPTVLAEAILKFAQGRMPAGEKVRFLDPAIGTGSFYSALRKTFRAEKIVEAMGYEIDPHYAEPAAVLWRNSGLTIRQTDFTQETPAAKFNLIVCNPPYVRHHHLDFDTKKRLQVRTRAASGMRLNGLAGLYCHFLGLAHAWMADGSLAAWLIPSEFMDVNYGRAVKKYLLERVTLLHIHRFDPNDVQFADALVSSAIVWFRNAPPPKFHSVEFSFGGDLSTPKISRSISLDELFRESKWTRFPASGSRSRSPGPKLADFFTIKRGLATGDNNYFILSEKEIEERDLPMQLFVPVLPSPRYLASDEVKADASGNPDVSRRLFLLDTKLAEEEIRGQYPSLYAYLEEGKSRGLHMRYLCRHRALWYAQEDRPPAPIVCTYLGRGDARNGRPFRFILNQSRATVANVYLAMYPKAVLLQAMHRDPSLIRRVWNDLNEIAPELLLGEGRVYGGGLHKLEPKELANVPMLKMGVLLQDDEQFAMQGELF